MFLHDPLHPSIYRLVNHHPDENYVLEIKVVTLVYLEEPTIKCSYLKLLTNSSNYNSRKKKREINDFQRSTLLQSEFSFVILIEGFMSTK